MLYKYLNTRLYLCIIMSENVQTQSTPSLKEGTPMNQVNLLEVNIDTPNTALNVMIGFLGIAQKRGAFAINESAKIFQCIEKFK